MELDEDFEWYAISENPNPLMALLADRWEDRFVDRAYIAKKKDNSKVVLHFEYQSSSGSEDFEKRMYQYNCDLKSAYPECDVISFSNCFLSYPLYKANTFVHKVVHKGVKPNFFRHHNKVHLKTLRWQDSKFYCDNETNPIAIAFWGLMTHDAKKDGVEMIERALEILLFRDSYPNEVVKEVIVFLNCYIYDKLNSTQKNAVEKIVNAMTKRLKMELEFKGGAKMTLLASLVKSFDEEGYKEIIINHRIKEKREDILKKMKDLNVQDGLLELNINECIDEEILSKVYDELCGVLVGRRYVKDLEVDIDSLNSLLKKEI